MIVFIYHLLETHYPIKLIRDKLELENHKTLRLSLKIYIKLMLIWSYLLLLHIKSA